MAPSPLQDRIARATGSGGRVLAGAVRAWTGVVSQAVRATPDPEVVLRSAFGLAEQALHAQREAALGVVRLVTPRDR
jgi:hypothetical protein